MRTFFRQVWNEGDESGVEDIFATDFEHHDLVTYVHTDRDGMLAAIRSMRSAFSRLEFRMLEAVSEADLVATRWRAEGMDRSGRTIAVDGMSFDRIHEGRIVENWTVWDRGGLDAQLRR